MGTRLISLKGESPAWRGISRLVTNDRGQRRFEKIENGYISADGSEIRSMPGWATMVDPSIVNNANGYGRYIVDAVRPIYDVGASPLEPYKSIFDQTDDTEIQTMLVRALPAAYFGFEQVGDELLLFGETRFREAPLLEGGASRAILTVYSVSATFPGFWGVTMSATVGGYTDKDASGAGLNGLQIGDVVYTEGITVADSAKQAIIDAGINGKAHKVTSITTVAGRSLLVLSTATTESMAGTLATAGDCHKIRPNRSDNYPSTGLDPFSATYDDRPDDHNALTVWRIRTRPDILTETGTGDHPTVYPAYVANRQRDFGDDRTAFYEGLWIYDASPLERRGVSRREQRRLPYRPNVDCATDRVILACPQYGCMYQIPGKSVIDPTVWPSAQVDDSQGIWAQCNGPYDKPRSLGIPKPRLIDGQYTPAQPSPSDMGNYNLSLVAVEESPLTGLLPGSYRFAISFMDSTSGEEGLASEPIDVEIPSNAYGYTISVNYMHPGYVMPECLVDRMNVYIAPPNEEALAFYGSFPLSENPIVDSSLDEGASSGIYGFNPTTPEDRRALWRRFDLPILSASTNGDLSGVLDPTRLAPQSATMPRGAEAVRYVRGVLFSGGAMGNAGPFGQLWHAEGTASFTSSNYYRDDEMRVRAHSVSTAAVSTSTTQDGDAANGTMGIAGRCFPDAYQGIEVISSDLLPNEQRIVQVDRVLNRRAVREDSLTTSGNRVHHEEILKLTKPVFDRTRAAGTVGVSTTWAVTGEDVYYVMPRGQLQIGDPGAPWRASRAFIKLIDPNRGDDITGIGQVGGSVVVCTRKETFSYSWYRNPAGEEASLMSTEFGCVAGNSMVEFDGGVAWLSERGPVAVGRGLQHVGIDIAEDFYGYDAKFRFDSRGMMRHSWGCHDASRGLVLWGMVSSSDTQSFTYEGTTYGWGTADDEVRSRWPCDTVLVWSYRSNSFSTWVMPTGMRIVWVRPTRQSDGGVKLTFLAEDGRLYVFDDQFNDSQINRSADASVLVVSPTARGSGTTLSFTGINTWKDADGGSVQRNLSLYLRAGMLVEFLDKNGNVTATTTIASVTTTQAVAADTSVIELSSSQTWTGPQEGQRVRIGGRPKMTLVSSYIGAETMDTMTVDHVQLRYTLNGGGYANATVKLAKIEDGGLTGEDPLLVSMTQPGLMEPIGRLKTGDSIPAELIRMGRRKSFGHGRASSPEVAVLMEIQGEAQVRIQDIALEVG